MAGIFDSILRGAGNRVRDAALSPQEQQERAVMKVAAQAVQVAAVVAAVASILFAAPFNVFTLLWAGAITYGCMEIYQVAGNAKQILSDATTEAQFHLSGDFSYLTQGAPLADFIRASIIQLRQDQR